MKKILRHIGAAVVALGLVTAGAAASWASPSQSAHHHHHAVSFNSWDGNQQHFVNQPFPSDCARIDAAGALIVGVGSCTEFKGIQCNSSACIPFVGDFQLVSATDSSKCLSYDESGARDGVQFSYDWTTRCGIASWNMFESLSSNNYSEWASIFNQSNGNNDCMWGGSTGTSNPVTAAPCIGTNSGDHWKAVDG